MVSSHCCEPRLELRHCGLGQCSALAGLRWFRFGLAEVPAVGLASILNPELPAGLGGLGAEDGLVKTEAVGQGAEGNSLEIVRVQGPEKGDGTPADVRVGGELVGPFDDWSAEPRAANSRSSSRWPMPILASRSMSLSSKVRKGGKWLAP